MTKKQLYGFWIFLVLFTAGVFALAQSALPPEVDPGKPSTWFLTAAGWGGLVLLAVNFLKVNVLHLRGFATIATAFVLAVGGSLLAGTGFLSVLGIGLEGTWPEIFTFGLTAFISSAGSWDTGKAMIQKASTVR